MTDRSRRAVGALVEADPEFQTLCKALYGNVDADLVYADVFDGGVTFSKEESKTLKRVGIGATLVGGALGVKELGEQLPKAFPNSARAARAGQLVHIRAPKFLTPKARVGITAAMLGGDAVATAMQARKSKLSKAYLPKHAAATASVEELAQGAYRSATALMPEKFRGAKGAGRLMHKPLENKKLTGAVVGGGALVHHLGRRKGQKEGFEQAYYAKYYSEIRPATKDELAKHPVRGGFLHLRKKPAKQGWMQATEDRVEPYLLSTGARNPDYTAKQVKRFSRHVTPVEKQDIPDLELAGTFSKFDDAKMQAFGFASVVKKNGMPVIDRQGDYIDADEMEKAAYHYVQKSRVGGDMHKRVHDQYGIDRAHHVSDLIESMVFTPEKCRAMGLPDEVAKSLEGHWWVGYQIHDQDTWEEVRKKGRTGFSIHGRGKRQDTSIDELVGY